METRLSMSIRPLEQFKMPAERQVRLTRNQPGGTGTLHLHHLQHLHRPQRHLPPQFPQSPRSLRTTHQQRLPYRPPTQTLRAQILAQIHHTSHLEFLLVLVLE
jgi:hypothetical protein